VTLHLRTGKVGGKYENGRTREFVAQGLMRAVSRYYAIHSGLVKRGDNLDYVQVSLTSSIFPFGVGVWGGGGGKDGGIGATTPRQGHRDPRTDPPAASLGFTTCRLFVLEPGLAGSARVAVFGLGLLYCRSVGGPLPSLQE